VQGVGGNANCLNVTLPNGTVVLEKEKLSPRFSVEVSRIIFYRVVDPDPKWFWSAGSGSMRAKNGPQKYKQ
jgi:hypothetical protein